MSAYFVFQQETPEGVSQEFVFKLFDPAKIAEARQILSEPGATKTHVRGTIVPIRAPYNSTWSFHLEPASISFFELAMEVCDANVSYVEENLSNVGSDFLPEGAWCPWSSRLAGEITDRVDPTTEILCS
jgi:hypothetical protein